MPELVSSESEPEDPLDLDPDSALELLPADFRGALRHACTAQQFSISASLWVDFTFSSVQCAILSHIAC